MSAQQRKLFQLKTKVGAFSSSKKIITIPQSETSRKLKQQRNSTRLPTLSQNQIMYSPIIYTKQNTVANLSISALDDFHKNTVKFFSQKSFDGLDYRRYKIKTQDYLFSNTKLGEEQGKHIFGMNDGHGTSGLPIANFIGTLLSNQLINVIQKVDSHSIKSEQLRQEITEIYRNADSLLTQQQDIDTQQSGATNLTLLIVGDQILSINCGDSKALFYYQNEFKESSFHLWRMKCLSNDHLPSRDTELQRIQSHQGRVDQKTIRGLKQGQLQIYTRQKQDQGVHVTRCFGHQLQKQVGVVVDPEFIYFRVPKSGYLVIGSSSLWSYLDNMDIGVILNKYNPPKSQSEITRIENEILTNANHYWDGEHDGIQDISLMIIYVDLQL